MYLLFSDQEDFIRL